MHPLVLGNLSPMCCHQTTACLGATHRYRRSSDNKPYHLTTAIQHNGLSVSSLRMTALFASSRYARPPGEGGSPTGPAVVRAGPSALVATAAISSLGLGRLLITANQGLERLGDGCPLPVAGLVDVWAASGRHCWLRDSGANPHRRSDCDQADAAKPFPWSGE